MDEAAFCLETTNDVLEVILDEYIGQNHPWAKGATVEKPLRVNKGQLPDLLRWWRR